MTSFGPECEGGFCHLRGYVSFPALRDGLARRYILDGKMLTAEEYFSHPGHVVHIHCANPQISTNMS